MRECSFHWYISTERRSTSAGASTPNSGSCAVSSLLTSALMCTSLPFIAASTVSALAICTVSPAAFSPLKFFSVRCSFHASNTSAPITITKDSRKPTKDDFSRLHQEMFSVTVMGMEAPAEQRKVKCKK